jgi:SH3 domain protein
MKHASTLLHIGLIVLALVLLSNSSYAESELPSEVTALFQNAFPTHTMILSDQCGFTAAAVMSDGSTQVLCLAEEKNGEWELVVSNPAALRQDTPISSLLLDTDETLFWSYGTYGSETETFCAARSGGQWRVMNWLSSENHNNGNISEYHLTYQEGRLHYSKYFCDENENILSISNYEPVPAAWLDEWMPLNAFDDTRFPKPNTTYTHSWLSDEATALAALELFPGDTYLGGCAGSEQLQFFLQRPNGERVIASCRFEEKGGWKLTISTPLPEGTTYGLENFSSSLVIGDLLVGISPVDDTTCGVTFIYNTADNCSGECMFNLGKNWITSDVPNGYGNCFGDHPWGDITVIDWNSLPHSFEEALLRLDTSDWAVVNNPNPADRLHLRVKADRSAKSLGKYYNGTPVRILETKGEWVHVDVFGVTGWMMKEYLVFGTAGHAVEAAFPSRLPIGSKADHFMYAKPETDHPIANYQDTQHGLLVLAVVGDDWYHVWFPEENLTGYVLQSDWWEGNG